MFVGKRDKTLIFCVLALCLWAPVAMARCAMDRVTVKGDWSRVTFSIELAQTPQDRATGLMHRTDMPKGHGMLFIYPDVQPVSFWMRNTRIPLDMLFIDENGVIRHIHSHAKPLDETPIPSNGPVKMVLEINAGLARHYKITKGSVIQHPLVQPTPVLPCD